MSSSSSSTARALALDTATREALRANLSPHAYESSARSRGRAAFAYESVLADGEATQRRYGEKDDDDDATGSDVWVVVPHTDAAAARVAAAGKVLAALAKRLVVGTPLCELRDASSTMVPTVRPLGGDDDDDAAVVRAGVAYRLSVRFRLTTDDDDDDDASWGVVQRLAVPVQPTTEARPPKEESLRPEDKASATLSRHVPKARAARRARAEAVRSHERVERLGRLYDTM